MMKFLTTFLKLGLIVLGGIVALGCLFTFPALFRKLGMIYPQFVFERFLFMASLYVSAVPFYTAEFNAYRILNMINRKKAFSIEAINAMTRIKQLVFGMGICYTLFLPFIYRVADVEDAPGMVLIVGAIAAVPYAVAAFAAILERLAKRVVF